MREHFTVNTLWFYRLSHSMIALIALRHTVLEEKKKAQWGVQFIDDHLQRGTQGFLCRIMPLSFLSARAASS